MYVGIARVVLQIPMAQSLKDRRQVVRSFKERARARLPMSIAEVGDVERLQVATLGASVVSGESSVCYDVLAKLRSMAQTLPEALLADFRSSVTSYGEGGIGVGDSDFMREDYDNEGEALGDDDAR